MEKQQRTELIQEIKYSSIPRESQEILLNLVENHLAVEMTATAARLTKVIEGEITYTEKRNLKCSTYCSKCLQGPGNCKTLRRMLYKLAEYENTAVTPETIKEFDTMYLEKCQEINRLHTQLEEVKKYLSICTVGDIVYFVSLEKEKIYELPIEKVRSVQVGTKPSCFYDSGKFQFCNYDIGETIFLSEEEAKEALQKGEKSR